MPAAEARLEDDAVVVPDESDADRLYNRGAHGTPVSGGGLALTLLEAAYLAEQGSLAVETPDGDPASAADLFRRGLEADPDLAATYPVYRDLRERGHIVNPPGAPDEEAPGPEDLHLYPRGGFPGETPSTRHVLALREGPPVVPDRLRAVARRAADLDKTLLVGVVDREADVTYYEVTLPDPAGELSPLGDLPPIPVHPVGAGGLVFDEDAREALAGAHLGHPAGPARQLAPEELAWLEDLGAADVASGTGRKDEPARGLRARAYADLRDRGLLPRSGFKYGADLRVYDRDPDAGHAPLLVDARRPDEALSWTDLAGRVRMAQSVRKRYLMALLPGDGGPPTYLELERTRP